MNFRELSIPGVWLIDLKKLEDERGFFARQFCTREFAEHKLSTSFVQVNTSLAVEQGTLRGFHYQLGDSAETKLVRCVRGALLDVIIDLRLGSPTFGRWVAETLSAENRSMMYVPRGFAHGFLTLEPNTEALYFVDAFYDPAAERGLRWNDPKFAVEWPGEPAVLSDKDARWPDFDPEFHTAGQLHYEA